MFFEKDVMAVTHHGLTPKQQQAQMIKTIGARMKEARNLAGYSQSKAAEILGYKNSSKLSKVEQATDTNSIPLWLIQRAALVYEVSVDWLFGLSDDWEISHRMLQERNTEHWLFSHMEKKRLEAIQILKNLHDRIEVVSVAVKSSVKAVYDVVDALDKVRNINKNFDEDIRGGNSLLKAVEKAHEIAKISECKINKFFYECRVLRNNEEQQGDLFQGTSES